MNGNSVSMDTPILSIEERTVIHKRLYINLLRERARLQPGDPDLPTLNGFVDRTRTFLLKHLAVTEAEIKALEASL